MRKQFREESIIGILKEPEAGIPLKSSSPVFKISASPPDARRFNTHFRGAVVSEVINSPLSTVLFPSKISGI